MNQYGENQTLHDKLINLAAHLTEEQLKLLVSFGRECCQANKLVNPRQSAAEPNTALVQINGKK